MKKHNIIYYYALLVLMLVFVIYTVTKFPYTYITMEGDDFWVLTKDYWQLKLAMLPAFTNWFADFLMQFFPEIMDYHFTANVEKDFDKIAEGKTDWRKVIRHFYRDFEPMVEKTMNDKQIEAVMAKLQKNLETQLNAKVRQ